jgi:hypothetical protein
VVSISKTGISFIVRNGLEYSSVRNDNIWGTVLGVTLWKVVRDMHMCLSQNTELEVAVSDFLNRSVKVDWLVCMLQAKHDLELKPDRFVSLLLNVC